MAACGAKILHLRCVEYARRYDMPIHVRSSFSQQGGHLGHPRPAQEGDSHGAGDHRRRRPRPQRGQDHRRRRARQGRRGGPHLRGAGRRRGQHRHGRAERLGRRDRPAPTSPSRCPASDGQAAMAALARIQDEVGYDKLLYDDQIGKVSLIGAGMRSHPGITAKFFAALASAGVNIEMISTSEIRISVIVDEDAGRRRRPGHPHGVRPRRRRGRGRRLRRDRPMSARREPRRRRRDRPGRRRDAPDPPGARLPGRRDPLLRLRPLGRHGAAVRRPRDHRRGRRDRRPDRARHRAVLRRRDHVARAGAEVRRGRRDRRRQLLGLPDGPRRPAGRLRGQPRGDRRGRARASSPTRTARRWPRCRSSSRCTTRPGWSG